YADRGVSGVGGYGNGGGGSAGGGIGYGKISTIGKGAAHSWAPLRERFDETVLWQVGVPTDERGAAKLEVALSDSITGWQVAVEAVSALGAVGHGIATLETYLPLHIDAEVPSELAVGDRYRIPIVLANHQRAARTLEVVTAMGGAVSQVQAAGAAADAATQAPSQDRAPSATTQVVTVGAGETAVVYAMAEARSPGEGTVELRLSSGGKVVDRVRRTLTVEPKGD